MVATWLHFVTPASHNPVVRQSRNQNKRTAPSGILGSNEKLGSFQKNTVSLNVRALALIFTTAFITAYFKYPAFFPIAEVLTMAYYETLFPVIVLVGRIIVGGYYLLSASHHFLKLDMLTQYAKSKNVPLAREAVLFSGLLLLLGGISVLLGVYPQVGVLLLALFLMVASFKMHNFWAVPEEQKMAEKINFLKNMALFGSTLMWLAIQTPWAFSLTI